MALSLEQIQNFHKQPFYKNKKPHYPSKQTAKCYWGILLRRVVMLSKEIAQEDSNTKENIR